MERSANISDGFGVSLGSYGVCVWITFITLCVEAICCGRLRALNLYAMIAAATTNAPPMEAPRAIFHAEAGSSTPAPLPVPVPAGDCVSAGAAIVDATTFVPPIEALNPLSDGELCITEINALASRLRMSSLGSMTA